MAERDLWRTHHMLADAFLELKSLSEQQARLMATASHDLRSPLTSIVGFVKLIAKDVGSISQCELGKLDRINDKLSIISDESERMLRLINELLDTTRPGLTREEWIEEEVNICDVIDKAHNSILGRLDGKPGVEVRFVRPDRCPVITASFDKLMQVFVNLLDNAVKFTPEGVVEVRLKTDAKGSALLVTVEDSGCGIEPERLPLIFESTTAPTTATPSAGWDCPSASRSSSTTRGPSRVASEKGVGTTFMVHLPI